MTSSYNYITIDNPNIPLLAVSAESTLPIGEFIESPPYQFHGAGGSLSVLHNRDMYLPNFSVRVTEGLFAENALFVNQEGKATDLLGSCLFLKGNMKSFLPKQQYMESHSGSQNFKYDPHNEFVHAMPANSQLHLIHFSFAADYFSQFLPENEPWADLLKNKISRNERIIGDYYSPIILAQERALQNIFDCPLNGKLGLLLMETSVVQIILLQMHALFNKQNASAQHGVARRDADAIHALKEYLSKTYLEDHSMNSLSKHFGMNTNKLMTVFKKLFGKCIFEYIGDLRMEHARQLLLEKKFLVHEVARTVGYKNPNHFSVAFKKRFGVKPSKLQ